MNFVDRMVGFVDPAAGLRRQAARKMLERSAPERSTRRFGSRSARDWYTNTGDPNDARAKRYVSRQTILKLVAENPFARKALNAMLNSVVGWGITGAPGGSRQVRNLWAEWVKVCDFHGRLDLYGLQELWVRSMLRDGEVFIVPRYVAGASVMPLRLQSFDKGMLATGKVGKGVDRGIHYDEDGRVLGYHFYRARQGVRWSTTETVYFPAEEVIHLFAQEWIGQTEGVSVFDSVVKRLGDVEEGIEAEVVKANISACMVGFRYRPNGEEGPGAAIGLETDENERAPVEEFVPGMIEQLEDGEQITFSSPPKSGGLKDLFRVAMLASSAGIGVTYEQQTGDLSNVNFSSYKAGELQFKRLVGRLQWLTIIPVCLDRVWAWFLKAGIDFGILPNKPVPVKWTPPPFESIDRKKDAEADILEMEAGLEDRESLLSARGYDHDEMIERIRRNREKTKAAGLTFKGDVAQPTASQAKQQAAAAA